MKKSVLYFLMLLLTAVMVVGCFKSSNPDIEVEEFSLNKITASISEDTPTGTLLDEKFSLGSMGSSNVPQIVLTGAGSEDFHVNIVLNGRDQNDNVLYKGNIELVHSLKGKGGLTYSLSATASLDGQSVTAPVTIHIVSEHKNKAPVAKIDMDENAVSISIDEGTSRWLTSDYSSDEDDGIVYCKWTDGARVLSEKTFTPAVGEIVSSTGCEVDLHGLEGGHYTFTLVVRDKAGLSDTNIATIAVKAKPLVHEPYLSGTPTPRVTWGDAYLFTPINGGDAATFTINNRPSWASFDTTTGVLSGTPAMSDIGIYHDINISASNAGGRSHIPLFDIEVLAKGEPYLFAWDDGVQGVKPWMTDGSVAGTKRRNDPSFGFPQVRVEGVTYFAKADAGSYFATELWKMDGTTDGTTMVADLTQGAGYGLYISQMHKMGKNIYFFALTGAISSNNNFEGDTGLWRFDTSSYTLSLIENFGDFSKNSFHAPGYLKVIGNQLFFQKDYDAGNGPNWNPWVSDGVHPSVPFKDAFIGANVEFTLYDVLFKGSYYGIGSDGKHGDELWKSDGTGAGTSILKDIVRGDYRGSYPDNLCMVGDDKLFFTATNAYADGETQAYDKSLWVSDGTSSGTVMIKDDIAMPSMNRNRFTNLVAMDGTLYFILLDVNSYGDTMGIGKLWRSDGTSGGTTLVSDMSFSSDVLKLHGSELLLWQADGGLWKSDGTASGTKEVKNFPSSAFAEEFGFKGGLFYFIVKNYDAGEIQFWRSDGTSDGTFILLRRDFLME